MSNTSEQESVWTVGKLLDWTAAWFREKNVEGGRLAAELLLARALTCTKIELYTRFDLQPRDEQRTAFRELVRLAGQHTPIAYLLGSREFFSLEFTVSPAVMIPRPETESLVQWAIDLCREQPERKWRVLDVGTGTGCIAITLAHYAKNVAVVASDISADALAIASTNVERHNVQDRVTLVKGNALAIPAEALPADGFDLILSNPPYISEAEWKTLPPNVRDHEPKIALTPGGDGLEMYRRFAADAKPHLTSAGRILVEIGHDQYAAVLDIFKSAHEWKHVGTHRDRTDPHNRVVEFQRA